jgi:hypothetical protein
MPTYDVPEVGRVTVTFSEHSFANSDAKLKSLDTAYDEAGVALPFDAWEKVNRHLRAHGLVS